MKTELAVLFSVLATMAGACSSDGFEAPELENDGSGGSEDGSGGSEDGSGGSEDGSGGSEDGSGGSEDGSGGSDAEDTTAPQVVTVSPKAGDAGVVEDEPVVIRFNEAMDEASVEGALSLSGFLPGELDLSWNSDSTELTVTPQNGFKYGTGTNPDSTTSKEYMVSVSNDATDLAGNSLKTELSSAFSTLNRISQTISAETVTGIHSYITTSLYPCPDYAEPQVGGGVSGGNGIYVLFNTSSLPVPSSVRLVESAVFQGTQSKTEGSFYPTRSLSLKKRVTQIIDETVTTATVTADFGEMTSGASIVTPTVDVTESFAADFVAGDQRQLFSVGASGTAANTFAHLTCDGFKVKVVYLTP